MCRAGERYLLRMVYDSARMIRSDFQQNGHREAL